MVVSCPHCTKQLKISEALSVNLQKLPTGKLLKVQCAHCHQGFQIDNNSVARNKLEETKKQALSPVQPPTPPDISWLSGGELAAKEIVEKGLSRALLVVPQGELLETLTSEINKMKYLVEKVSDTKEALKKIRHNNYKLIVYYSSHGSDLSSSSFHNYLYRMPTADRRNILYVIIGSDMNTFYDLQALSYSANLVVNDTDVAHIGILLKKVMADYQELITPFLTELHRAGE